MCASWGGAGGSFSLLAQLGQTHSQVRKDRQKQLEFMCNQIRYLQPSGLEHCSYRWPASICSDTRAGCPSIIIEPPAVHCPKGCPSASCCRDPIASRSPFLPQLPHTLLLSRRPHHSPAALSKRRCEVPCLPITLRGEFGQALNCQCLRLPGPRMGRGIRLSGMWPSLRVRRGVCELSRSLSEKQSQAGLRGLSPPPPPPGD